MQEESGEEEKEFTPCTTSAQQTYEILTYTHTDIHVTLHEEWIVLTQGLCIDPFKVKTQDDKHTGGQYVNF